MLTLTTLTTFLAATTIDLGGFTPATEAYSVGSETNAGALANMELMISNAFGGITILSGLAFIGYFLVAAFRWVTSGGDKGKVESARNQMTQGLLGLIIVVASYGIVGLLGSVVGLQLLNPGKLICELAAPISGDSCSTSAPATPAPPGGGGGSPMP